MLTAPVLGVGRDIATVVLLSGYEISERAVTHSERVDFNACLCNYPSDLKLHRLSTRVASGKPLIARQYEAYEREFISSSICQPVNGNLNKN